MATRDWNGFKKSGDIYIPNDATARASISVIEGKIPNGTTSSNPLVNQSTMENALDGKADVGDVTSLAESVSAIEDKIPSNASSSNQLATRSEVSAAYKPKGNATLATLPPLTNTNLNNVYNMTEDFTTTADFAEGAGIEVKAGNEVGIINIATDPDARVIKYTVLGGFIDLSEYATQASVTSSLADKVDKVAGKGLSTNDYNNTAKGIVDNIQSNVIANTKLIKDTVGWSGKNKFLIKLSYVKESNQSGTWNGNTYTINGGTFVFDTDANGYVTNILVNGTFSANTTIATNGFDRNVCVPKDGNYILNGISGGSASTYSLKWNYRPNSGGSETGLVDVYNGDSVSKVINSVWQLKLYIIIKTGSYTNIELKPMIRDASILDSTYEPYRNTTAFPRDEQAILGAKNWFYSGKITDGRDNITDTDNGKTIRIHNTTAGSYKIGIFQMPVEKNTDYIFTTTVDWTSGVGNVGIASENAATDIKVYGQITSDKDVEVKFNSGNNSFIHVKLLCTWSDSVVGDVTYTNNMLRLATDPDPTYARHAMTNEQLTEDKVANSVIASVENGNTSSQAYNIGDYFIRNNLICKANKAISAGETLVAGSTHSTGTLGLFMNKYLILDGAYVQTLSNGSDLNDLSIGEARVSNTDAPSILNRPSEVTTSFFIITIQIWGSEYLRQILFARDTANIYTRVKASTWGNWYKIGLTQV